MMAVPDFTPDPELRRPTSPTRSRRALPALALPERGEDRRAGALLSVLLHVAIIALLVAPIAAGHELVAREQGAGGPGLVGGGGGGRGGTGGQTTEHLQYMVVAPPPAAAPTPTPAVQPVIQPPKPTVTPPQPVVQPPVVQAPVPDTKAATPTKPLDVAATSGVGGGTGKDGTNGNGPGSGGGVGSGIGPGRGSGVGPGTGGGTQANYPPSMTEMFMPPLPKPRDVDGTHILVEFDVDETGRVLSVAFTPTRDRGYNKRLDEVFRSFRFRPGTRPDGTPIRMKFQIGLDL